MRHEEIELKVLVKVHIDDSNEGEFEDITDEFTFFEGIAIAYLVRQALTRDKMENERLWET